MTHSSAKPQRMSALRHRQRSPTPPAHLACVLTKPRLAYDFVSLAWSTLEQRPRALRRPSTCWKPTSDDGSSSSPPKAWPPTRPHVLLRGGSRDPGREITHECCRDRAPGHFER